LVFPGLFLAVYGFSRLYWINQMPSVLLPVGLPARRGDRDPLRPGGPAALAGRSVSRSAGRVTRTRF
ncbi:MAG: hypothetical protein E6501_27925, partial [Bradyrhizobium sp.]|nr:hypothetical protein [Bradyrhizobium sp.]